MATYDETENVMSNAITIWRAIAAAAVGTALSIGAAQANAKVTFRDVLKPNGHERSKAEKLADGAACGTAGPTHELTTTLPVFEKCMRAKGWVLVPVRPAPPCLAVAFGGACDLKASFKVDRCGLKFLTALSGGGGGRLTRRRGLWTKHWCRARKFPRSPGATAFRQAFFSLGVDKHGRSKPRLQSCRVLPPCRLPGRTLRRRFRSHHPMSLHSRVLRRQAEAG
jgi:hypothetical protein